MLDLPLLHCWLTSDVIIFYNQWHSSLINFQLSFLHLWLLRLQASSLLFLPLFPFLPPHLFSTSLWWALELLSDCPLWMQRGQSVVLLPGIQVLKPHHPKGPLPFNWNGSGRCDLCIKDSVKPETLQRKEVKLQPRDYPFGTKTWPYLTACRLQCWDASGQPTNKVETQPQLAGDRHPQVSLSPLQTYPLTLPAHRRGNTHSILPTPLGRHQSLLPGKPTQAPGLASTARGQTPEAKGTNPAAWGMETINTER